MPAPRRSGRSWGVFLSLALALLALGGLLAVPTRAAQEPGASPAPDLIFNPAFQVGQAQAGAGTVYHFTLQNNTGAAVQVSLALATRQGWSVTINPPAAQVAAHTATNVDVTVQAGTGASDRVTLTASAGATTASAALALWTTPSAFTDLHAQDWPYGFVQFLVAEGVLSGYSDGSFRPGTEVTRAQFAKMLVSGMGWALVQPGQATFSDVPVGHWAFPYVETAAQHSVLSGYADHTFRPNNNITRAQLTKSLVTARGWTLLVPAIPSFSDVRATDWAYPYVETAADVQVLSGYSDGTFRPNAPTTRAQVAKILVGGLLRQQDRHVLPTPPPQPTPAAGSVYWGAYIKGATYGYNDPPWDARPIDTFEAHAGKRISILSWGQAWADGQGGTLQPFETAQYEAIRQRGSIPFVDWEPWQSCCGATQPAWRLSAVINGTYDTYIRQWATDARNWGHPFFVRLGEEMNGTWYPWSEHANGNAPGQFIAMWRHVHDIFTQVGATNVTWVWNPNREWAASQPFEEVYPGDAYVDWVALDGYNWGNSNGDVWTNFAGVFGPSYDHLTRLAPSKPVMIAETASTERAGSKPTWMADALTVQIPTQYPRIKALVWFNWNADGMDWVIESSPAAQSAFIAGIGAPYYAANTFANLPFGPIQPLR